MHMNSNINFENNNLETTKRDRELKCAQTFIDWYNKEHGSNYKLIRTEEVFPELKGRLRWEFVAHEDSNPGFWFAIEVKEILKSEMDKKFNWWQKICQRVTNKLQGQINGEFAVILYPDLYLDQNEQQELAEAISKVIIEQAPNIQIRNNIDIGANIKELFPKWPNKKEYDINTKELIEKPEEFKIQKCSEDDCCVDFLPIDVTPNLYDELQIILKRMMHPQNGAFIKADRQLKLAKEKGAKYTRLLLYCHILLTAEMVINNLRQIKYQKPPNIDNIYAITTSIDFPPRIIKYI